MWTLARILIAIGAALVLYLIAAAILRKFWIPAPEEPEPGELRPVHHRYRCVVCGAEVTMTAAPTDEVPEAPRHCREDMALVVEADADGG
ncbi:MAG: hypothetical protein M5U14_16835 [Acidimicrobiia bacterium]|nr:hypothetical protein [Acidimicrobiia bacterium]